MDNTQRLIELFKEFPGIGPRQAKRFVYFLLNKNSGYTEELIRLMHDVKSTITTCKICQRFSSDSRNNACNICRDDTRDKEVLMLVSHDVDFENIERTKSYTGYYFVLGGNVPILEKNPEKRIRQKDLLNILEKKIKNGLKEIIIALNYNPEGENTLNYLTQILKPLADKNNIKISTLGRGLSTGTELEYSDSDTIKNALKNRQ